MVPERRLTVNIVDPNIESYIESLRGQPAAVLREMEQLAEKRGFPVVGPEVGRLLFILARSSGARRVLELGSGFGYSAYWLAMALPEDGTVYLTDSSYENRRLAESFLSRAGFDSRVRFEVGDALELVDRVAGPFDIVFNDVDKEDYPATVEKVIPVLRPGGLFITDNVLWKGRVTDRSTADSATEAVRRFNQKITRHPHLETVVLPLRDGLAISMKR
jgi:predicted O-methyltransferase YrrM